MKRRSRFGEITGHDGVKYADSYCLVSAMLCYNFMAGETNDYKYITSKKAVKIAPTQMGGVGDYDEDLDEYDSEAEMSGEEEEEEAVQDWKNLNLSEEEMQNYKQKQEELEGNIIDEDDEEDEEDDDGEENLQKFDNELRKNVITEHHPELMIHNYLLNYLLKNLLDNIFLKNHLYMTSIFDYNYTKLTLEEQNNLMTP